MIYLGTQKFTRAWARMGPGVATPSPPTEFLPDKGWNSRAIFMVMWERRWNSGLYSWLCVRARGVEIWLYYVLLAGFGQIFMYCRTLGSIHGNIQDLLEL